MFYKKYFLYNDRIEVMLPSNLKMADSLLLSQHYWFSEDKKIAVNITRGGSSDSELSTRLSEYYKEFVDNISRFDCSHIAKREINERSYGEMRYTSFMMGYHFFNYFLLGSFMERELLMMIQYMDNDINEYKHVFENILDSLKIIENGRVIRYAY